MTLDDQLRRAVRLVALLNLAYFGVEFAVALKIGSVSLFADSVDFLEDAAVNFLIFAALGWNDARRARVGMGLAGILLIPAIAFLWRRRSVAAGELLPKFFGPMALVNLDVAGQGRVAIKTEVSYRDEMNVFGF